MELSMSIAIVAARAICEFLQTAPPGDHAVGLVADVLKA